MISTSDDTTIIKSDPQINNSNNSNQDDQDGQDDILIEFPFLKNCYEECKKQSASNNESSLDYFERIVELLRLGNLVRKTYVMESEKLKSDFKIVHELFVKLRSEKIEQINKKLENCTSDHDDGDRLDIDDFMREMRDFRKIIIENQGKINDMEENPKMLESAKLNEKFVRELDELSNELKVVNINIPWQVAYSSSFDSGNGGGAVEFNSGKITDRFGDNLWEDRCGVCDWVIQSGGIGEGNPRYRCISSNDKNSVKCEHCYGWMKKVEQVYFNKPIEFDINTDTIKLEEMDRELYEKIKIMDPFFGYPYILENNDVVFMKLNILNSPNLHTFVNNMLRTYSERPCVGIRQGNTFTFRTYAEVREELFYYSLGFSDLLSGNQNETMIGISTNENRVEYTLTDLMCTWNGFTTVGLQPSRSTQELNSIIDTSGMQVIVCEGFLIRKFLDILHEKKDIQFTLVSMDPTNVEENENVKIITMDSLIKKGKEMYKSNSQAQTLLGIKFDTPIVVKEDTPKYSVAGNVPVINKKTDECEILYMDTESKCGALIFTSGSTSKAKGCIIENRHWIIDIKKQISHDRLVVEASFSPQSLGADRVLVYGTLLRGGRVVYCRRGVNLFEDLPIVNPTGLVLAPSIVNSLYNEYLMDLKSSNLPQTEIVQKYRNLFGKRISLIGIGGAHVSPELINFLKDTLGLTTAEGFGCSECGGIATNGIIHSDVQFKLLDVPEMNFFSTDLPLPRGEIAVKTSYTIQGYYKNEQESNDNFTSDGYYKTGDIVVLDPSNNSIKIIDRRKNIFKLAISEFVSPSQLEVLFEQIDLVNNCCIYGDSSRDYVIAIVRPVSKDVEPKQILQAMRNLGKIHGLRHFEIPREVIIDQDEWTIENNMLTPSGKVSRFNIYKKHTQNIENAYANFSPDIITGYTDSNVETNFRNMCKNILEVQELDMSKSFSEMGGTSMKAVRLLFSIQRVFSITENIPINLLIHEPLSSVFNLISLGSGKKIMNHLISQQQKGLLEEVEEDLRFNEPLIFSNVKEVNNKEPIALITGATGFVGSHLVSELAQQGKFSKLICLVRADSDSEAERRLAKVFETYKLEFDSNKIRVLSGDVSKENFGLDSNHFDFLLNSVTSIYHIAARVEFAQSYSILKGSNVNSMKIILKFISNAKYSVYLHHISTISVYGDNLTQKPTLYEKDSIGATFSESGVKSSDGYSQTKWVTEKLLENCKTKFGFKNFKIYRLGLSSWSFSGIANPNDWFTKFIQSIHQLKSYPTTNENVSLVPVDFICKSIIEISHSELPHQVYHIVNNSNPIPFKLFIQYLEESLNQNLKKMNYSEWIDTITDGIPIYPLLPYIKSSFPPTPKYDNSNSQSISIKCSPIDQNYVNYFTQTL